MARSTSELTRHRHDQSERPHPGAERRARARARVTWRRRLQIVIPAAVVVVVAVVAIVLVGPGGSSGTPSTTGVTIASGPRAQPLAAGERIRGFAGPGLTGGRVEWSSYRGSATVLAVWAPWCPHCQKELPVLGRIAPDYPMVNVMTVVTAIGDNPGPSPEGFFAQHHLVYPTAVDDAAHTLMAGLGVQGFPTVYFVGPDGRVVSAVVGEASETAIRARFAALQRLAA
jgi:thiol-disulfide isomerase/thioredoxin